ncbi:MAG: hypothetical protein QOF68_1409 [Gaiellales bacterium]|jgi:hypothetical protein|nr:hypothetical protein [Gaiellales bacterium]
MQGLHSERRPVDLAGLLEHGAEAPQSRGQVLRRGATAFGALTGWSMLAGSPALAASRDPRPIPGGFDDAFNLVPRNPFIHVLPPGIPFEMATITDFDGIIAATEIQGTARGSDGTRYTFDADMRFMRGRYVAMDGKARNATFGFI